MILKESSKKPELKDSELLKVLRIGGLRDTIPKTHGALHKSGMLVDIG